MILRPHNDVRFSFLFFDRVLNPRKIMSDGKTKTTNLQQKTHI